MLALTTAPSADAFFLFAEPCDSGLACFRQAPALQAVLLHHPAFFPILLCFVYSSGAIALLNIAYH